MKKTIALFILIIVFASSATAIPSSINYQGYLTRTNGSPLDTTVAMTFNIYEWPFTVIWTETQPAVVVQDGLFNITLGQVTPLVDSLFARPELRLGISVGEDYEMSPLISLNSVPYANRVATVDGASGGSISGSLSVGSGHSITAFSGFAAGESNSIGEDMGSIAGGVSNTMNGLYGFIGAGAHNIVSSPGSVCGGGYENIENCPGGSNTISGGYHNNIEGVGWASTLAGGRDNHVEGYSSAVGGGAHNRINGWYSFIGGGGGDEPLDSNYVGSSYSVIGGGQRNFSVADYSAITGGLSNRADGEYGVVGGGQSNEAFGNHSVVGGGHHNHARGSNSVIAGGGGATAADSNAVLGASSFIGAGVRNRVSGDYSFLGSGFGCQSLGNLSVVGGGEYNYTNALRATIAGGFQNQATGQDATVGGGNGNIASGSTSTVPGGAGNEATAFMATAMGFRAKANHIGAFVWADRTYTDFASTADNQFSLRASGGVHIATTSSGTVGVKLDNGDTAWEVLSDSTKKSNRRNVNTDQILQKVVALPIQEWNYTQQSEANIHIGPMAQDFYALFGYGDDKTTISTIDPDGVALAAIQELAKRIAQLEKHNTQLMQEIQTLKAGNSLGETRK